MDAVGLHRPLAALLTAAILALALLAFAAAAHAPRAAAATSCGPTDARPGTISQPTLRRTTLCLVNRERARRGRRALRHNRRLAIAGIRHARDMVRRNYFSHDSPSGASFLDRIRRTGYFRGARSWAAGENLAWGSGGHATPRSIVRSWMASPGHRANILQRRFREIGVGIVLGTPRVGLPTGATYATEFGLRR